MRFIPAVSLVQIQLQPPMARWSRGLRHRPFTAVTRVRIPSGSPESSSKRWALFFFYKKIYSVKSGMRTRRVRRSRPKGAIAFWDCEVSSDVASASSGRFSERKEAPWSKVVGAPSRPQLLGTTRVQEQNFGVVGKSENAEYPVLVTKNPVLWWERDFYLLSVIFYFYSIKSVCISKGSPSLIYIVQLPYKSE